jgi:hypothetical protein
MKMVNLKMEEAELHREEINDAIAALTTKLASTSQNVVEVTRAVQGIQQRQEWQSLGMKEPKKDIMTVHERLDVQDKKIDKILQQIFHLEQRQDEFQLTCEAQTSLPKAAGSDLHIKESQRQEHEWSCSNPAGTLNYRREQTMPCTLPTSPTPSYEFTDDSEELEELEWMPCLELYKGDYPWKDFAGQFRTRCRLNRWDDGDLVNILHLHLSGPALHYFVQLPATKKMTLEHAMEAMECRFGCQVPTEVQRSRFRRLSQNAQESLQEFADRVKETATLAFPSLPADYLESEMVSAFLRGISNQEAGLHVLCTGSVD